MSAKSSKDRASLCAFSFSDGRQCRIPRHKPNSRYCLAHARKTRHLEEADEVAQEILEPLSGSFVSSASMTQSLIHLYAAVTEGRIPPKQASALAKVSSVLMKSIDASNHEFQTVSSPPIGLNSSAPLTATSRPTLATVRNPIPSPTLTPAQMTPTIPTTIPPPEPFLGAGLCSFSVL